MTQTFTLEYWEDGGWFVGRLRGIPGVFSQGQTLEELKENIREAYELMTKDEEPLYIGIQKLKTVFVGCLEDSWV